MDDQETTPTLTIDPARLNVVMFGARRPQEYRCQCSRLLGKFVFMPGMYFSIKCGRCGRLNTIDVPLNSTSAPVMAELLDRANGHTPALVVEAAGRLVLRLGGHNE